MTLQKLTEILHSKIQNDSFKIQAIDNWCDAYFSNHNNQLPDDSYDKFLNLIAPYLSLKDDAGNSLAHMVAASGYDKVLDDILKLKPDAALQFNDAHRYPIHVAILNNNLDCVKILLSIPSVVTLEDAEKRAAIHYAALYGNENIMELCCKKTPHLEVGDTEGKTPIILAMEADNEEAKGVLERHGVHLPPSPH